MLRQRSAVLVGAFILVIAAAIAARTVLVVQQPLWLDEVVSARIIIEPSVASAVSRVRLTESSPPGWHLLSWVAWRAVGRPARLEWLRLLSVFFGALLAGLVIVYARAIGLSRMAAGGAGVLMALGPNVVEHGAELRPYALLTLLALLFAIALTAATREPSRSRLLALAVVVLAGSYTHYFFLLPMATGLAWAIVRLSGPTRTRVAAAMVAGSLPFLIWVPSFVHQYRHNLYAYNGSFTVSAVAYSYARVIGLLGETGTVPALVRLLFAAVVVVGALLLARRRAGELAALLTVVPIALTAFLWLLGPHIFNERNLLVTAPFIAVSIGAVLDRLSPLLALVVGSTLAIVLVLSLWHVEVDYGRSSYDGIAHALVAEGWHPGDVLIQFGPSPLGLSDPVSWYLPGHPSLVRARPPRCAGRLFAVSYDGAGGARWVERHAGGAASIRLFRAFDHTPRGPASPIPIRLARVGGGASVAANAVGQGARLLRDAGVPQRCG